MDWTTLRPHLWNLAVSTACAASAAGCGPALVDADGEPQGDDTTSDGGADGADGADAGDGAGPDGGATDDEGDSGSTPADDGVSDGPPPECVTDSDCLRGKICEDSVCIYDPDYCYDYYDYYSDDGCGPRYCETIEDCIEEQVCEDDESGDTLCADLDRLPACDDETTPTLALLPEGPPSVATVVSLAFVDGDGDETPDLVVGNPTDTRLHPGVDLTSFSFLPIPEGAETHDVASGDLNGDDVPDLVAALGPDGIAVLLGDGLGGYVMQLEATPEEGETVQVAAVQFDGDEAIDIVARRPDRIVVLLGDGAGGFGETITLTEAPNGPISVSGGANVIGSIDFGLVEWLGGEGADAEPDATWFEAEQLQGWHGAVAGTGDSRTMSAVVRVQSAFSEWTMIASEGIDGRGVAAIGPDTSVTATGDFDRDGVDDLLLGGANHLTFVRRTADGALSCASSLLPLGEGAPHLLAGDITGDGYPEVVTAEDSTVRVWTTE